MRADFCEVKYKLPVPLAHLPHIMILKSQLRRYLIESIDLRTDFWEIVPTSPVPLAHLCAVEILEIGSNLNRLHKISTKLIFEIIYICRECKVWQVSMRLNWLYEGTVELTFENVFTSWRSSFSNILKSLIYSHLM